MVEQPLLDKPVGTNNTSGTPVGSAPTPLSRVAQIEGKAIVASSPVPTLSSDQNPTSHGAPSSQEEGKRKPTRPFSDA